MGDTEFHSALLMVDLILINKLFRSSHVYIAQTVFDVHEAV
jgi:hypothetical protein